MPVPQERALRRHVQYFESTDLFVLRLTEALHVRLYLRVYLQNYIHVFLQDGGSLYMAIFIYTVAVSGTPPVC